MKTIIEKTEYEMAKEVELSENLAEIAKTCPVKYATKPTPSGSLELRENGMDYIGLTLDPHGDFIQAFQIMDTWKRIFDNQMLGNLDETEAGGLIAFLFDEARDYQHLFITPEPFIVPQMPAVTPMMSSDIGYFGTGVDIRLVDALLKANEVIDAYGFEDERRVNIYKTADGFFIGKLILGGFDINNKTGIQAITYMSAHDVADLQAKIGAGSDDFDLDDQDAVLALAISAIEKSAAEVHPVTPWDLIPNSTFWKESCRMM